VSWIALTGIVHLLGAMLLGMLDAVIAPIRSRRLTAGDAASHPRSS
jgi:hypothetical protein